MWTKGQTKGSGTFDLLQIYQTRQKETKLKIPDPFPPSTHQHDSLPHNQRTNKVEVRNHLTVC